MCQNTNHFFIGRIILITVCILATPGLTILAASTGANFAQTTLDRAEALAAHYPGGSNVQQRDNALQLLRKETSEHLSHLSRADRIDYAEYMANVLAKTGADQTSTDLSEDAMIFITAGTSEQEIRAGDARLLSSVDPAVSEGAENLAPAGDIRLPNGERGQDITVFELALHDPKVPQDRLISALFKLAPVESAQWFADHTGLPANERAGLESDLQKAWKLHRAVNDPLAKPETKAMLDDSVKKPLLIRWSKSPSWILRSLADGLLRKHQEWQTPDLKEAVQSVQIPAALQISSTGAQATNQ